MVNLNFSSEDIIPDLFLFLSDLDQDHVVSLTDSLKGFLLDFPSPLVPAGSGFDLCPTEGRQALRVM